MNGHPKAPQDVMSEAVDRFTRLRAAEPTDQQLSEHEAWLTAAPEHRDAYDFVTNRWAIMDRLRGDAAIMFIRERAQREIRSTGIRRMFWGAAAASVAAAVVTGAMLAPGFYSHYAEQRARNHAQNYHTSVGQIAKVTLADGSLATLDTDSEIKVWRTQKARFVELVRGRARFEVKKDATHPFSVLAAGKSVTALGTDFDVYLQRGSLRVTLLEGRLRVVGLARNPSTPAVEMTAGYRLTASASGWGMARVDAGNQVAWTDHQLTFADSTLGEIADELNRYSPQRIVIADAEVRRRRMSATFKTTEIGAFLSAVDQLSLAKVQKTGEAYELLPR
jgi:transmembrane sensor